MKLHFAGSLAMLAACGRVGFDSRPDGPDGTASDGRSGDGAVSSLVATSSAFLAPGTTTSVTVTTAPVGAGHLVILPIVIYSPTSNAITGVTDDGGNSYVAAANSACSVGSGANSTGTVVWYAKNTGSGATSVTLTFSTNRGAIVWLLEVAGMDPASPLEAGAMAQLPGAATAPAPAVAAAAGAMVVSAVGTTTGNVTGLQAGDPFTAFPLESGSDGAYDLVTTAGSYGAVWMSGAQAAACASTAAFR